MSRPNHRAASVALALVLLVPASALAQAPTTQRVQFKPGATSASIKGTIKGHESIDYVVGAKQGQAMNVSLATKHGATYFNILAPGETEVAFFNGSVSDNQYEGTLPASGDFRIRVYMMRSAARRNEVANYTLEIIISGAGAKTAAAGHDAKVPGTDYHATGNIPCAMGSGQPAGSCAFGVRREAAGTATVVVTKPDGRTRTIFFDKGKAVGYDQSQADRAEFKASRQSDVNIVHIGGERYEIPDAVTFGG
ncbi:MAG TPA: hypothetical protein VFX50_11185 [Gemmatimonadales bacterium]|nr:hypothetical protein [Gemmatimonadales bacterium]